MERSEIVRAYKHKDVPTLIAALKEHDPTDRSIAARYLGKLRAAEAVPALQECLAEESSVMRGSAIHALAAIGDEQAIQALIFVARGGNLRDRRRATWQLGNLGATEAVPTLLECLDKDNDALRISILNALGRIGDERAIPRVAQLAENAPSLAVSTRATNTLATLGDTRAIPQIVSLLTQTDQHLRDGRWRTYYPDDMFLNSRRRKPGSVKWSLKKWAAKRLVELRAVGAASAVEEATKSASSLRERLLLRRAARRLRASA